MKVLPIDEKRIGQLAETAERIEDENPRRSGWKARKDWAYQVLANATNDALSNAQRHAAIQADLRRRIDDE